MLNKAFSLINVWDQHLYWKKCLAEKEACKNLNIVNNMAGVNLRGIDLFAGAGGMSKGAQMAGICMELAVESDLDFYESLGK